MKSNSKKKLIAGVLSLSLFSAGFGVGKLTNDTNNRSKHLFESYKPLSSDMVPESSYLDDEAIIFNNESVVDGKKIAKEIEKRQDKKTDAELVYAFRKVSEVDPALGTLSTDIIYVSKTGNKTTVHVDDEAEGMGILNSKFVYEDADKDKVINPISTDELRDYKLVPYKVLEDREGISGWITERYVYVLKRK